MNKIAMNNKTFFNDNISVRYVKMIFHQLKKKNLKKKQPNCRLIILPRRTFLVLFGGLGTR